MNDSDIEGLLRAAKTPERTAEYWDEFPRQVVRRLRAGAGHAGARSGRFPRLAWGMAAALSVGILLGVLREKPAETASPGHALQNDEAIGEIMAMFPNRVRAIVQDERGLSLVLSERSDVPASTPLWIRVCDGRRCASVVTFSGQEVRIAGHDFTILSDAGEGVIVVGEEFAWASQRPSATPSALKIQARRLELASAR